ncbi:uncharacterized protein MYCFIDRAFT_207092 [Pseudocercospora fijiensis CIRAD86]|uniref:Uncharacterized protein n=1 Tax=Pseudocercospora fijiensis (strain CIRAD86) TaxID=383855 RepID=M3B3E2_PSEFD|nr:uncharacterized protein MYCFIDRAFT_207092 [Pseudocercospora fijiensis CIRAD86]EME83892.1 hypothetical protein MYCFIDRAFT_207092 [Pseudocercospora fijiensis CIRAD86]
MAKVHRLVEIQTAMQDRTLIKRWRMRSKSTRAAWYLTSLHPCKSLIAHHVISMSGPGDSCRRLDESLEWIIIADGPDAKYQTRCCDTRIQRQGRLDLRLDSGWRYDWPHSAVPEASHGPRLGRSAVGDVTIGLDDQLRVFMLKFRAPQSVHNADRKFLGEQSCATARQCIKRRQSPQEFMNRKATYGHPSTSSALFESAPARSFTPGSGLRLASKGAMHSAGSGSAWSANAAERKVFWCYLSTLVSTLCSWRLGRNADEKGLRSQYDPGWLGGHEDRSKDRVQERVVRPWCATNALTGLWAAQRFSMQTRASICNARSSGALEVSVAQCQAAGKAMLMQEAARIAKGVRWRLAPFPAAAAENSSTRAASARHMQGAGRGGAGQGRAELMRHDELAHLLANRVSNLDSAALLDSGVEMKMIFWIQEQAHVNRRVNRHQHHRGGRVYPSMMAEHDSCTEDRRRFQEPGGELGVNQKHHQEKAEARTQLVVLRRVQSFQPTASYLVMWLAGHRVHLLNYDLVRPIRVPINTTQQVHRLAQKGVPVHTCIARLSCSVEQYARFKNCHRGREKRSVRDVRFECRTVQAPTQVGSRPRYNASAKLK